MDDRRLPWLASAIVLALLPIAFLFSDWPRVLAAFSLELVLMFYFAFLVGRNNA